ncbi:MAG: YARHG domain-containing protein [Acidobacteria bacterium]|nr:YARHG domain-containing protein [Acidobacteriota bacterium]MBV9929039.1 YARHG domain-containing protein [Acidobacteriota bacterium]
MKKLPDKLRRAAAAAALVLLAAALCPAQDDAFKKLEAIDYAKQKATREQLKDVDLGSLKLLRGVVFGRHGRIFKDRDIQGYLKDQAWYKPNPGFTNSLLNETERENLDLIRELEAEQHDQIEPGDLRWWQAKEMTEEKLGTHSSAEWQVLRAEVEAVRGKPFDDDPWLKSYFEDRYWYKADPSYDARQLTATERKNLTAIEAAQRKQRHAAISPGDMEHFENRLVTEEMLKGLSLNELRLLRNEVYARHGRQFKTEWLAQYFWSQPWYEAREDNKEPELSETDKKNIETIVAYERKVKESLSTTPVTNALLEGMFLEDARKLRNEIYARHGKVFKDRWLQGYFKSFDWYKPNPKYTDAALTEVERQNAAAIAAYEKKATSVLDAVEG